MRLASRSTVFVTKRHNQVIARMIHLMLLVLLSTCCVAIADNQLDVSPEGRAACRGESITYTCIRTDTDTLRWRFDGASVGSFFLDGSIGVPQEQQIMGVEFTVTLTEIDKETVSSPTANITSTLMVTASPALDGRMISCDAGIGTTATDLMIDSDPPPTSTPTIASITQVGPNQVNVTINEPTVAPNCVTDYIIQYEGGNVSTGGNSSVVIPDVEFCQLSTVSFTVTATLRDGSQTGSTSMDLSLIGVGQVTGVVITEDDTDPSNVVVEWTEPENGGGCACISQYTIAIDGQEITTTGQCGDPQVVIPESEVGEGCIDHSLIITPVLQTGTTKESSRSDLAEFPFGETSFPSPALVETTSTCSTQQWIVTVNWASFPEELRERYPDFNITIGYGLSEDSLELTAVRTNDSTVGLDYDEYQVDEEVTFCVTFVKDNCMKMNCTTEKLENSISVAPGVYIDGTTAVLSVTYGSCIAEDPDDLELRYTYDPPEGTGYPVSPALFSEAVTDLMGVETQIELTGLKENTQYQYNVSLVRRSDGATIGVGVSGKFIVGGVYYCNEETTMSTGATVGITVAITFVISLTIGAVVASTICYCYFKRKMKVSISQPQAAVYEEMPSQNLRPSTTQAMEMKDNRAYGPVTPRGGPVYEVPGGAGAAVTSNQGILVGENVAYGPVS